MIKHISVGMRLEGKKETIIEAMECMQKYNIHFYKPNGFFGEDEGKEKVRVYTTALLECEVDDPEEGKENE